MGMIRDSDGKIQSHNQSTKSIIPELAEKGKPTFWPKNPYPIETFPMTLNEYSKMIPDDMDRTALSGCLGRYFWDMASEEIYSAMKDHLKDLECTFEKLYQEIKKVGDATRHTRI